MDTIPVTLVVKAANQQFEDQVIQCESTWTIRKLKDHLSEVYPCKPSQDEQKIIYSGQLLTDIGILKDILRQYDGSQPQTHTIHLVYTPKNRQIQTNSTNKTNQQSSNITGDGLRQRNVGINQNRTTSIPNINPSIGTNSAGNCPVPGISGTSLPGFGYPQPSSEYIVAQQMAMQNWMQQAYIQYMNQYMNLLSIGVRPETVFMQQQNPPANLTVPNIPSIPNINLPSSTLPTPAATTSDTQEQNENNENNPNVALPNQQQQEQQQQPQQQQQQQQEQPRFPNIVQEDAGENRDWLDMFYSMSRIMLLLTLVYFYSSPLRCLFVLFIGLAIYLYHVGTFRTQGRQAGEANNNNNNVNNNNGVIRVENAQVIPNAGGDQVANPQQPNNIQEQNGTRAGEVNPADASIIPETNTTSTDIQPNNGPTVIAFLRTFVVSFFVSLLPETPAL